MDEHYLRGSGAVRCAGGPFAPWGVPTGYRRGVLALAAFVPESALLVPGAAGRAVVLEDVRAAALDAVREVVAAAPDRVVVVAPGPVDRVLGGPVRPSLAAAGIHDADLGWAMPGDRPRSAPAEPAHGSPPLALPDAVVPAVGASVALLLLAHAGWAGRATVVEVGPGADGARAAALRTRGAGLAAGADRVALVLAGSLSARHGPDGPRADDERAAPFDAAALADLALGDRPARLRLGAIPGTLAEELVVTAWAPLQVLLGAAADLPVEAAVRHASAPFGVMYAVAVWRGVAADPTLPPGPGGGR